MPSYTLLCPPLPTTPRIARDFVATVLRELGIDDTLIDDAAICTSELVTNACVHAGGDGAALWVEADDEGRGVRVVVYDGSLNSPVIKELSPEQWAVGGRGLCLVDALTEGRWGADAALPYRGPDRPLGKGVWFDLAARARA